MWLTPYVGDIWKNKALFNPWRGLVYFSEGQGLFSHVTLSEFEKLLVTLKWSSAHRNCFVLLVPASQWVLQVVSVMDFKWEKTYLLIPVASSSSFNVIRIKMGKGEQIIENGLYELSYTFLSWQDSFFSWSLCSVLWRKQVSFFFSSPSASPRFLKSPGTFSPCYLALSCKQYPFCHHLSLGERYGGNFPSENPVLRWNVAPSTPPALQKAIKRRQELMPRISEYAFPCRELFWEELFFLTVEELPRCAFMKRNDHLKSVGLLL